MRCICVDLCLVLDPPLDCLPCVDLPLGGWLVYSSVPIILTPYVTSPNLDCSREIGQMLRFHWVHV
jgi:hypothetical protein